jgi:hypothetical protein
MNWLVRVYAALLRLYPYHFRAEFGDEMRRVFAEAVNDAARHGLAALLIVCAREMCELPAALVREHSSSFREAHMTAMPDMHEAATRQDRPASGSWLAALATALPFLVYGLTLVMERVVMPDMYGRTSLPPEPLLVRLIGYLILLIGLGVGWVKGFPRWAYGYISLAYVAMSWWMDLAAPHMRTLGIALSTDWSERLGWRALIPFGVMTLTVLVWTRSLRPLRQLVAGLWEDWTRVSLVLYGFFVWLMLVAGSDSFHHPLLTVSMLVGTCILALGAGVYTRVGGTWRGVAVLLLALLAAGWTGGLLTAGGYSTVPGSSSLKQWPWYIEALRGLVVVLAWAGVMYMPGLLGLIRRKGDAPTFPTT